MTKRQSLKMKIQFLKPNLKKEDIQEAVRVLQSGWLTYSRETQTFEKRLARYLHAKGAVFNSSGTAALHVSLLAAGVSSGDEVITTPLSYVATSNAILYVGAKPVFVDVDNDTGLIDLNKIKKAITRKTKAIIPVHLFGQMVDMKGLTKIIEGKRIKIIEDAAHALEAERDKIKPGQLSSFACLSFHAAKNITSGEGGAVVTNDSDKSEILRVYGEGGIAKETGTRRMVRLGFKYSGTNFQAALLINQLERIEQEHRKRKRLWEYYAKHFRITKGLAFPLVLPEVKHAYHMFVVWVNPGIRRALRDKLEKAGIQTSIHYDPIHLEPFYRKTFGYRRGDFPIAERLGFSTITLPLYPSLTRREQDFVITTLKRELSTFNAI